MCPNDADTQAANVDDLLRAGIAAAQSKQRERARELLMRVVEQDEENVWAWSWLATVVDSLDDREVCLENVLALDPDNEAAREGLALLRSQPPPPTGTMAHAGKKLTPAAAEDSARRQPPPETPSPPPQDEFDNEYLCPYCAAQTDPDDRECKACGGELWSKTRRREQRSHALWTALVSQTITTIYLAIMFLLVLFYAAYRAEIADPFTLLPVYLGLPGSVPPELAAAALAAVPRLYVLTAALLSLFSLGMVIGLYLRWRPAFFSFLFSAILILLMGIMSMLLSQRIGLTLGSLASSGLVDLTLLGQRLALILGGGGVVLALLMFRLTLQIDDDFSFDEKRILLSIDGEATSKFSLLSSGNRYMKYKMWAMAAIHLRRAAVGLPERIGCHLALAAAYANLKRYELAAGALEQARRINPDDPQVTELAALLDDLRSQSTVSTERRS